MKKVLALGMIFLLVFSMAACSQQNKGGSDASQDALSASEQKTILDNLDLDAIDEINDFHNLLTQYDTIVLTSSSEFFDPHQKEETVFKIFLEEGQLAYAINTFGPFPSAILAAKGGIYYTVENTDHIFWLFPKETYEENLLSMFIAPKDAKSFYSAALYGDQIALYYEYENEGPNGIFNENIGKELVTFYYNRDSLHMEGQAIAGYSEDGNLLYEIINTVEYDKEVFIPTPARDNLKDPNAQIVTVTAVDLRADGTEESRTYQVLKGSYFVASDSTEKYLAYTDAQCSEEFSYIEALEEDITIYFKAQ